MTLVVKDAGGANTNIKSTINTGEHTVHHNIDTVSGTVNTSSKIIDSTGADVSDTTNHAIKVNVVAGGAGGGAVTVADGAAITIGSKIDAKSTATDTTSVSAISIWKQISASVQALVSNSTALGRAALTASVPVVPAGYEYETVAASQTDQVMGPTGAVGDYIEGLLCVVATPATSQVQIKDGAGSAITVLPNAVAGGIGTYYLPIMLTSTNGAWKITTAAGVSLIGIGDFT